MKIIFRTSIDRDLAEKAKEIARKRDISFSAILERALDRYLPQLIEEEEKYERRKEEHRA